jgi:hypothetical protein
MHETEESCCPGLASSVYRRGPTDTNPAMFPFEKVQADAIASRSGKATSDIDDTTKSKNQRFSGPGST